AAALERAGRELGLGDRGAGEWRALQLAIEGWGPAEGADDAPLPDTFCSAAVEVGLGAGRFRLRLARHGSAALRAAEEAGDFDLAPLELQLVATSPVGDGALAISCGHTEETTRAGAGPAAGGRRANATTILASLGPPLSPPCRRDDDDD
ncbi:unnamed protein product, partial [Prorocentrum cordatum]